MQRALLMALCGLAIPLSTGCGEKKAPPAPPAPDVKVATVLQRDVPVFLEAIGQTRGATEIEVRARVGGYLQSMEFREGYPVRKGQLLYTIDPRPFEAAVATATARLAQAEADLARAQQDVARYEPLVAKNAIPRQQYETAVVVARAAEAAVEAAKGQVRSAQLDLSFTRVTAPAGGLIGKTEVYPGTLVGGGQSSLLAYISQIETIHVRFTMAEKDYLFFARRRAEQGVPEDAPPRAALELVLADGSVHPHKGSLVFVDRNVDPTTGTILLEAAFPNPGMIVRPGQYARVRALVDVRPGAILVPQRAVSELQGGYNVALVGADDTVTIQPVKAGERIGNLWLVEDGLKAGDRIVVEGLQKVRPGGKVKPETITIDESSLANLAPFTAGATGAAGDRG